MRLVKAALFLGLLTGLGFVWTNREPVIAAYRDDPATAAVRLDGIDLAYRPVEVEPSPFRLPSAPDTRRLDPGLPAVLTNGSGSNSAGSVPVLGGRSVLEGTILGPNGPVDGALIKVDRLTADGIGSVEASADAGGTWRIEGVQGGRFRVRAWLPNRLTMPTSDVRFVASGETAVFDFTLAPVDPSPTLELVHGGLIYDGLATEIAVVASTFYIDDQGLVVARPLPDVPVTLASTGAVVTWPSDGVTGEDGSVRLNVQCRVVARASTDLDPTDLDPTDLDPTGEGSADEPMAPPPSGTLTATTEFQIASFALPGCLPIPEPETEPNG